jgi:glycosyltransferase involved in cell wall biosynthesis
MRPRVLLLITELRPAGAERIVYELALGLGQEGFEVRVACLISPGPGTDGAVAESLRAAGVEVTALRLEGKRDLRGAWRLWRLLRELRPDVVHAHLFHANLAARVVGRLARVGRVVSTVHIVERRRLPARALLDRLTSRLDDATVCVSQAVARYAVSTGAVRGRALRVIHNGVDLARFADPGARAGARAALGLPLQATVLGGVGRLDPQKGFGDLLEAFAPLAAEHPDALLALAGDGPLRAELETRARALGLTDRVRFLGHRDDVPCVLAALDVFCMPSRWEGFGLALVEALAAGVPAVVSAVDSLPEVLGQAGVLVPAADPPAWTQALSDLLGDPERRAALSAAGPDQAQRFTLDRMLEAYAELYRELLAG